MRCWLNEANSTAEIEKRADRDIRDLLEWYICECITYGPKSLRGWWSDGVVYLEIAQSTKGVKLIGVTWIDCLGFAPFEIDVEITSTDPPYFTTTVFRIGMRDERGCAHICGADIAPTRVCEMRPRYNWDWAMAVELTPPPES